MITFGWKPGLKVSVEAMLSRVDAGEAPQRATFSYTMLAERSAGALAMRFKDARMAGRPANQAELGATILPDLLVDKDGLYKGLENPAEQQALSASGSRRMSLRQRRRTRNVRRSAA